MLSANYTEGNSKAKLNPPFLFFHDLFLLVCLLPHYISSTLQRNKQSYSYFLVPHRVFMLAQSRVLSTTKDRTKYRLDVLMTNILWQ